MVKKIVVVILVIAIASLIAASCLFIISAEKQPIISWSPIPSPTASAIVGR